MRASRPSPIAAAPVRPEPARMPTGRASIGAALMAAFLLSCGANDPAPSAAPPPSRPVTVEVVTIQPEKLEIEAALTGQLGAEFSVMLKSEVSGVIESIEFEEGTRVAKGDVLFRLRDATQRARLREAEAEVRLAEDIHDRTQRLTSKDISSIARRAEATAALDEARAKLELAQVELERTFIRAPFDGVVGSLMVGPGQWVQPETSPLVEISAVDRLQLSFTVPEPSLHLARLGGTIHARVNAYPGERFPGKVFFVSPAFDPASRRLLAKAWIPNDDHRLKPGMFANVDVLVAVRDGALLVPEAGVVYDRVGTYVWRVDAEGIARKVPVEIGYRVDGRVVIDGGLSPGDRVVATGVNKLRAGSPVNAIAHHGKGDQDVRSAEGPVAAAEDDGVSG